MSAANYQLVPGTILVGRGGWVSQALKIPVSTGSRHDVRMRSVDPPLGERFRGVIRSRDVSRPFSRGGRP